MRYRCDNCGHTAAEGKFLPARDLNQRLDPGGKYTDKECPKSDCGALAYPVEPKARKPKPEPVHFGLMPRGSGRLGPCRFDMVLTQPWRGLPAGESIGQVYLNDENKRHPNRDRHALAFELARRAEA